MTSANRAPAGFWIGVSAVLGALCAADVFTRSMNHDAAWYLYTVGALERGAGLYQGVADTNPPLIIWLTWPAVWVARVLGMTPPTAFGVYVFALAAMSAAVSSRLFIRAWPATPSSTRAWSALPLPAIGLLAATVTFALLPFVKTDFGQREHLAMVLVAPYVFLSLAPGDRRPGRIRAVLIGCAGGLGFVLKPHFLGAWLIFEAGRLPPRWRAGPLWRSEFQAALAVALAYTAGVAIFVPEYREIFADVRQLYGGYDSPLSTLLRLPDLAIWIAACAVLGFVRFAEDVLPIVTGLFAAATGFLASALLQAKGWSYHMYPDRAFLALFFVAAFVGALHSAPALIALVRGGWRHVTAVAALALTATSARYLVQSRNSPAPDLVAPLVELIRRESPSGPVAMLSMRTVMYPAFPAVNEANVEWSLRFPMLWYLPGLYRDELTRPDAETAFRAPVAMSAVERRYFDEVIAGLCAKPPGLLLVEPPPPRAAAGRRALDLVAYYSQDARFAGLFARYSPLTTLGPFVVYTHPSATGRLCE